jgi:plastocyanin
VGQAPSLGAEPDKEGEQMHRSIRKIALFCALGMIVSLTAITTGAHAAATSLGVQVGNDLPVGPHCNPSQSFKGCFLSEGTRFLPGEVTVHKGDTINFNFGGFHTVTLIPANQGADDWRHDNWNGTDKPYSIFIPDTDDGAGQLQPVQLRRQRSRELRAPTGGPERAPAVLGDDQCKPGHPLLGPVLATRPDADARRRGARLAGDDHAGGFRQCGERRDEP